MTLVENPARSPRQALSPPAALGSFGPGSLRRVSPTGTVLSGRTCGAGQREAGGLGLRPASVTSLASRTRRISMCALPVEAVGSWVTEPDMHWWGRCDGCGKRRIRLALYDCFPVVFMEGGGAFYWQCAECMIVSLTAKAAERLCPPPAGKDA